MASEFEFLSWVRDRRKSADLIRVGIGDDLAVLNWPKDDLLLVGVDQVLDGVHVDSAVHLPRDIGRKAMNRNLSDCAAMACLPAAALVTMVLPHGIGDAYAKELYLGIESAGEAFDCPIVGGDTASWPGKLMVTVSILGRSAGVTPVTRAGAKPGDRIYVTGALGGSILGRHMTFEPRVQLARQLAAQFTLHAMADLSDGLARDLRNICQASAVGAVLQSDAIPIHPDVRKLNQGNDLAHAITDGEDYELLIVSPDALPSPCVCIGYIQEKPVLEMETAQASTELDWSNLTGWEHQL